MDKLSLGMLLLKLYTREKFNGTDQLAASKLIESGMNENWLFSLCGLNLDSISNPLVILQQYYADFGELLHDYTEKFVKEL